MPDSRLSPVAIFLLAALATVGCAETNGRTPMPDAGVDAALQPDASPDAGVPDAANDADTPLDERFVGAWVTQIGSGTMTCDDVEIPLGQGVEGTFAERNGGLVLTDADGCEFPVNVNGSTAAVAPGTYCEETNAQGTTQQLEVDSLRFTLAEDGQTLEERFEATLVTSGASESRCALDFTGTLERR